MIKLKMPKIGAALALSAGLLVSMQAQAMVTCEPVNLRYQCVSPPQGLAEFKTVDVWAWVGPFGNTSGALKGTARILKNDGIIVAGPFNVEGHFRTTYTAPRFGRQLRLKIVANDKSGAAYVYGQLTNQ